MNEPNGQGPGAGTSIAVSAVAEDLALVADFYRGRMLFRANQVDQLRAENARQAGEIADLATQVGQITAERDALKTELDDAADRLREDPKLSRDAT